MQARKEKQNVGRLFKFIIITLLFVCVGTKAQLQVFSVKRTSFSSAVASDFSPVYYKNGLVFCSNALTASAVSIKSDEENLFNILFVSRKDSLTWKSPELFSNELFTILNEGPATFSPDGKMVFFARNNIVEGKFREINKPSNKYGIFSAELVDGAWSNISPFPHNNANYMLGTPSLSADGQRLYFASDMPGGYGGMDLYYCDLVNGEWLKPVNMGSSINTPNDEAYPFACPSGRLFFSSDGHNSMGGKDIFYTTIISGKWTVPVRLEGDINSTANDYGIVADINLDYGYFSSDRRKYADIYSFNASVPHFGPCEEPEPFEQCFKFFDERFTDTLHLEHEWYFGNGTVKKGISVEHCFSQPGNYIAVLTIKHFIADTSYSLAAEHHFDIGAGAYSGIIADNACVAKHSVEFMFPQENPLNKNYSCFWDFGQGFGPSGATNNFTFANVGTYTVKLGIEGTKDNSGRIFRKCFAKKIDVLGDYQQLAVFNKNTSTETAPVFVSENLYSQNSYRILNYYIGRFEGSKYALLNSLLDSLALNSLDFDENNLPLSGTVAILDNYIEILNNNADINLAVAVHQNNRNSSKYSLEQTVQVAESVEKYMAQRVINNARLTFSGYGDIRPVVTKSIENARLLNKRVEFIFIKNDDNPIKN
ncbi:MAG: PD40 domain-containing protein [Bacteroidales bacterium]|nr:PD40 domain-containing protein [Bacteroidales bacterium]